MVKCGKIQLLLHRKIKSITKMAKKKSNKTAASPSMNLAEVLSIDKIFHNERLNFFIGILLFILSIYTAIAFVSFFSRERPTKA